MKTTTYHIKVGEPCLLYNSIIKAYTNRWRLELFKWIVNEEEISYANTDEFSFYAFGSDFNHKGNFCLPFKDEYKHLLNSAGIILPPQTIIITDDFGRKVVQHFPNGVDKNNGKVVNIIK